MELPHVTCTGARCPGFKGKFGHPPLRALGRLHGSCTRYILSTQLCSVLGVHCQQDRQSSCPGAGLAGGERERDK